MSEAPKRRMQIRLTIGADDSEALSSLLYDLATRVDCHEIMVAEGSGTSGGWASGYTYEVIIDPEMTGDRYRQLLSEWHKASTEGSRDE